MGIAYIDKKSNFAIIRSGVLQSKHSSGNDQSLPITQFHSFIIFTAWIGNNKTITFLGLCVFALVISTWTLGES